MASDGTDYRQQMVSQLLADVLKTDTWAAAPLSGNGQEIGPLLDCSRWQLRQFRRHRQGERRRARGHPAAFSTRTTTRETGILQLNVHQRRFLLGVLRQAAPSHAPAGGAPLAAKGPSEVGVRVPVAGRRRDHPSGPPAAAKLIKSTWRRLQGEHQNPSLPRPPNAPSSQPLALSSTQALNALVFVRAPPRDRFDPPRPSTPLRHGRRPHRGLYHCRPRLRLSAATTVAPPPTPSLPPPPSPPPSPPPLPPPPPPSPHIEPPPLDRHNHRHPPASAAEPPLPEPLTKRGCSAPPRVLERCASQTRRWGWGAVGVTWWERVLGSTRVEVPRARARGERRARAGLLDV